MNSQNTAHSPPPLPLEGLKILDFSRVLAGPLATALLADLGAEVIKVEPPQGDDYRAIGPFKNGESALFSAMNRNKKSIVLDLKSPTALTLVREMVLQADALVENFRPGVAERLGIGYAAMSEINPKLVYVSVSGFGQTGPMAHRPAYDIIVQAMSGIMEVTGQADGPPTMVGEAMSDVVSGLFASWGLMVALHQAARTGQGQHVDVAMFDSTLAFLTTSVSRYLFTGVTPRRVGNRHPLSAPFGIFRAQDGYFALAVLNEKLFAALARAIGQPELPFDTRFTSDEARSTNEPALRAMIEAWSSAMAVVEVVRVIDAVGVPVAPLWNIEQALESDQARHRGVVADVRDERLPGLRLPTQPVHFNGSAANLNQRAPRLGEHTHDTLSLWLGASATRIAALRDAGAFGEIHDDRTRSACQT